MLTKQEINEIDEAFDKFLSKMQKDEPLTWETFEVRIRQFKRTREFKSFFSNKDLDLESCAQVWIMNSNYLYNLTQELISNIDV